MHDDDSAGGCLIVIILFVFIIGWVVMWTMNTTSGYDKQLNDLRNRVERLETQE